MPVAKITGQGLIAIACSVALLWICLIGERVMLRNAATERVKLLREMQPRQPKPGRSPAIAPLPVGLRRPAVAAG